MIVSKGLRTSVTALILMVSALVWVFLVANPGNLLAVHHCAVTAAGPSRASWQMLLEMNPVSELVAGWALMVVAMMLPKLTAPVIYICDRSFKRRRLRSTMLFVVSYLLVWIVVGIIMTFLILSLNLVWPKSYLPAIITGMVALIWQCSPVKQRCLNRGHNHRTLAAFGRLADRDAVLFGLEHGYWCVGSGWALMLFPMLLPAGHNLAMFIVTILMISEHMDHPRLPRWRMNFSTKLLRMLIVQAYIRVHQARDRRIYTRP